MAYQRATGKIVEFKDKPSTERGRCLSRRETASQIWKDDFIEEDDSFTLNLEDIQKKLGTKFRQPVEEEKVQV